MKAPLFNPFEDRLSRDIRNNLSETIFEVLHTGSLAPAEAAAAAYRQQGLEAPYLLYIDQRLKRYGQALELLEHSSPLLDKAAVLWDLGLFFEVHEILEPDWIDAAGDEKRLLQALIRAAGVYIYLELGYQQRAAKISSKAVAVLEELEPNLEGLIDVDALLTALRNLAETPPRIRLA